MIRQNLKLILCLLLFTSTFTGCAGQKITPMNEQERSIRDLNERALKAASSGRQNDANKLLAEALLIANSMDNKDARIITLLNQSRLARHAGMLTEATRLTDEAMLLATNSKLYSDVAQEKALQGIAENRLDDATKWAEQALQKEQGNLMGRRLNLLARIQLLKNNLAEAELLANQGLSATKDAGMELEHANSLRMLGIIKTVYKDHEQAEELLQQALEIDRQQAEPLKIAADLDALAELAGKRGDDLAEKNYRQRGNLIRKSLKALQQDW